MDLVTKIDSEFTNAYMYCSVLFLILNGSYPLLPDSKARLMKLILFETVALFETYLFVYSLWFYDLKNNLTNAFSDLCMIQISFIVGFQHLDVGYHAKYGLSEIIKEIDRDYIFYRTQSKIEQDIISKHLKNGKLFVKLWTWLIVLGYMCFLGQPVIIMIYKLIKGNFKLVPIYELVYPPWLIDLIPNKVTFYFVKNFLSVVYTVNVGFTYCGVLPVVLLCMDHAVCRMEICELKFGKLFSDENKITREERAQEITEIVKLLHDIYDYMEKLQKSLIFLFEMILKTTSIIIPVLLYAIIEALKLGEYRFDFMIILTGAMCISNLPCYFGEQLVVQSDRLRESLYTCGWEKEWDKEARKSLLLILTRMERPTVLRSVFRIICLETSTGVFQVAYTLFNVLSLTTNR